MGKQRQCGFGHIRSVQEAKLFSRGSYAVLKVVAVLHAGDTCHQVSSSENGLGQNGECAFPMS